MRGTSSRADSRTSGAVVAACVSLLIAAPALAQPDLDPSRSLNDLALTRWLEAYESAWESKNPDQAAALFTVDATYQETPFDRPFEGRDEIREYWAGVTADQKDIDFEFEIVTSSGMTGIARWSASFRTISGDQPVELEGIFVLEFASDSEVGSLREWWHVR